MRTRRRSGTYRHSCRTTCKTRCLPHKRHKRRNPESPVYDSLYKTRYAITKHFTSGLLKDITIVQNSPVPFKIGKIYGGGKYGGGSKYRVLNCVREK